MVEGIVDEIVKPVSVGIYESFFINILDYIFHGSTSGNTTPSGSPYKQDIDLPTR